MYSNSSNLEYTADHKYSHLNVSQSRSVKHYVLLTNDQQASAIDYRYNLDRSKTKALLDIQSVLLSPSPKCERSSETTIGTNENMRCVVQQSGKPTKLMAVHVYTCVNCKISEGP